MINFVCNILQTVKGDFADYQALKPYHYISSDPVCIRAVYKITAKQPYTHQFPDPLAVIVYAAPLLDWKARNIVFPDFLSKKITLKEKATIINQSITYIARIIVDPRFHRLGIASKLLKDTIDLQPQPIVESMTPLDKYGSMFLKAGFKSFFCPAPEKYAKIQAAFLKAGILQQVWDKPEIVQQRIDLLPPYQHAVLHKEMRRFNNSFRHHTGRLPSLARTFFICEKIQYPSNYFYFVRKNFALKF